MSLKSDLPKQPFLSYLFFISMLAFRPGSKQLIVSRDVLSRLQDSTEKVQLLLQIGQNLLKYFA